MKEQKPFGFIVFNRSMYIFDIIFIYFNKFTSGIFIFAVYSKKMFNRLLIIAFKS